MATVDIIGAQAGGPGTAATNAQPVEATRTNSTAGAHTPSTQQYHAQASPLAGADILLPDDQRPRERFLPITRFALMDRLTSPKVWNNGEHKTVRRFFRYLDYWRHQCHTVTLLELEQTYEPFSPDSDLLMTRKFTDLELETMQQRVVEEVKAILAQANYEQIDPQVVSELLTRDTHYGLDLEVDFDLFEECLIYYRGASTRKENRRVARKFWRKEEFDVQIFQRLFVLFKMKPLEQRTTEIMKAKNLSHKDAEKKAKRQRAHLPADVRVDNIYMKLFKNIPRSDVEMIFPNTLVKFRMFDKLKLGGGGAVGLGSSLAVAAGKAGAVLTNPIAAVTVLGGVGVAVFRQTMNFINTKQRYMVIMAQNLYFHSMADNRGVMIKLTDRAADEDVKEEMLLYAVLAKEKARRSDLDDIDRGIEKYLKTTFGIDVDFDLDDALSRLMEDGIVREGADGYLETLPPDVAAKHLDAKWDVFLDNLPDIETSEGTEFNP